MNPLRRWWVLQLKNRLDAPYIVEILDVTDECSDVKTLFFDYPNEARPGQFLMVWVPQVDEVPMSLSFLGQKKGITIKKMGEATSALHGLKEGDRIGIRGPYGTHFEKEEGENILVVAGGIGLAPLAPLIEGMGGIGCEVSLALGARTESELIFENRLQEKCKMAIATDDGSKGYCGFVSDLAQEMMKKGQFDRIFTCGPEAMMKKVVDIAAKANIPVWASLDRYMKCGVGLCDSCAINGLQVCTDGPVFSGEVLLSLEDFGEMKRDACGRREII
ncbi:MAG: dihydroorotate dehydrogenase electron transfer subunit [Thermoplasmata archaeon]|nr:MAG: dihydroorotate dehydrogenase electron transfer subunit [Thermoplasmata archaeon]